VAGKDVFQTDTSVNRGNSGGPLLDRRGYMVGVNTSIARVGAGNMPITGVNFAVKSSVVREWLGREGYRVAYGTRPLGAEAARPEGVAGPPPQRDRGDEAVEPAAGVESPVSEVESAPEAHSQPAAPAPESDTILTPERPYEEDALFEQVEREMEDLMEEMRRKIRR
jgi:serine protease Do